MALQISNVFLTPTSKGCWLRPFLKKAGLLSTVFSNNDKGEGWGGGGGLTGSNYISELDLPTHWRKMP